MKRLKRWIFLGNIVVLVIWSSTLHATFAYEYVQSSPIYNADWTDPVNDETGSHEYDAEGAAGATSGGTLVCYSTAYAEVRYFDNGGASATSWAEWSQSWQWNGPAGTAPGGTLDWEHDADGSLSVDSSVVLNNADYVIADCIAESDTEGSEGSWAEADAESWVQMERGWSVSDGDISYSASSSVDPPDFQTYPSWGNNYLDSNGGHLLFTITWDFFEEGNEAIASGTGYVTFSGNVFCDCAAGGATFDETGSSVAWADSTAHAGAGLEADFTSN